MQLFSRNIGKKGPYIIIVHGLYGASDNWQSVASELSQNFRVLLPDLRNHGQSPHSDIHTYQAMADDLLQFIKDKVGEELILVGHSMGGKVVMRLALNNPEVVRKMLIIDIAPRNYGDLLSNNDVTTDHKKIIDTLLSVKLEDYNSRKEINEFFKKDLPSKSLRQFLMKNIKRKSDGSYFWQLNLQALHNNLPELLDGFSALEGQKLTKNIPTIFIRGEKSPYIREDDSLVINRFFPGSQIVNIPDAGHWLHVEQSEAFLKTLLYFVEN